MVSISNYAAFIDEGKTLNHQGRILPSAPVLLSEKPAGSKSPQEQLKITATQGQALQRLPLNPTRKPSLNDVRQGAVLSLGDSGPAIESMQKMLTEAGFGIQTTGQFGSTTEAALKQFQAAYGLQCTGQLGPTTLKTLENPLKTSVKGKKLATKAQSEAQRMRSFGRCYEGVANALSRVGVEVWGLSAYMAAPQLAKHPQFREARVSAKELKNLPAGAVVVWGKTAASPHGHISVALGDGREASDHIETQMTHLRGYQNFRVFLPK